MDHRRRAGDGSRRDRRPVSGALLAAALCLASLCLASLFLVKRGLVEQALAPD